MGKWFIMILFPFCLLGQEMLPTVTTFSSQHGLPPLKILHIAKDSSGYLWLASNLGLHRFDGKRFQFYNELPDVLIGDIEVRSDGKIFISLFDHGLASYNASNDAFETYEIEEIFENTTGNDFDITFGRNGEIFTSLNGYGILELNDKDSTYNTLINKEFIYQIEVTNNDEFIIASDSLYLFKPSDHRFEVISPDPVTGIELDGEYLWYSTKDFPGIVKYSLEQNSKTYFSAPVDEGFDYLSSNKSSIAAIHKEGLCIFNKASESWKNIRSNMVAPTSIFVESTGRYWFGQDNKLHAIDPINQKFKSIADHKVNYIEAVGLSDSIVAFVPFDEASLHFYNLNSNTFERLDFTEEISHLEYSFDAINVDGKLWIALLNGIAQYNLKTQSFKQLTFTRFNDFFTKYQKIEMIYEGGASIWIYTIADNYLFKVDKNTLQIDSMNLGEHDHVFMHTLRATDDGKLEALSKTGLTQIDFNNRTEKLLPLLLEGQPMNVNYSEGYIKDKNQVILVADGKMFNGLVTKSSLELEEVIENENAFSYSENLSLHQLNDGRVAILTSAGIKLFDRKKNEFQFFGIDEGLNNIDRRTRLAVINKHLFFLGNGVVYTSNEQIGGNSRTPSVNITSFEVQGERHSKNIFKAFENDFKITFESIDLTKPLDVKYRYRLSEDHEWISADYDENTVYYPALRPGEYEFQVITKHKFSEWSQPDTYYFKIKAPIWKTWWFSSLLVCTLAGVLYLIFRYRLAKAEELVAMKSRVTELENKALRAQMNPHFIFNSLNSIKSYIIEHDRESAADYLTNFSELVRLILANSREKLIPLKRELHALELYIEIENIRLENKFTYSINNNVNHALIPPLSLQPFVENAIWHGIVHKKGKGHLKIDINSRNGHLTIVIQDDGVGRRKSQELKRDKQRRRSFGIVITKERLATINSTENIIIDDLYTSDGRPNGTKVTITLPLKTLNQNGVSN